MDVTNQLSVAMKQLVCKYSRWGR